MSSLIAAGSEKGKALAKYPYCKCGFKMHMVKDALSNKIIPDTWLCTNCFTMQNTFTNQSMKLPVYEGFKK